MIYGVAYEGGGARGAAYGGSYRALEECLGVRWHKDLKVCTGSSAGAIMASIVASKPTARVVERILDTVPWKSFKKSKMGIIRDLFNTTMTTGGGWYSSEPMRRWLGELYVELYGSDLTFLEVKENTGVNLVVTTVDELSGRLIMLSADSYGDTFVSDGVCASASIPFWFPVFKTRDMWLVDGGLLSNHPVDALKHCGVSPKNSIAFRLDGRQDKERSAPPRTIVGRARNFVRILMNHSSKSHVPSEYWDESMVIINTGKHSSLNFKLSKQEIEDLKKRGYEDTCKHLNSRAGIRQ